jgi:hypothetical protein
MLGRTGAVGFGSGAGAEAGGVVTGAAADFGGAGNTASSSFSFFAVSVPPGVQREVSFSEPSSNALA